LFGAIVEADDGINVEADDAIVAADDGIIVEADDGPAALGGSNRKFLVPELTLEDEPAYYPVMMLASALKSNLKSFEPGSGQELVIQVAGDCTGADAPGDGLSKIYRYIIYGCFYFVS
jgi:hypothetical protein